MSTISETASTSSKSRAAKEKDPFEENGLMDEIERLVAPPVLDPKSLKFTKALRYRKPRAVNLSHCQSCLGDGDLVCCDRCPASYHLRCHQPPLEEEDIPAKGKWLCHRCQIAPLDVDDEFSAGGLQNGHVTPSSAVADLLLDAKQAAMRKEKRQQAAKLSEDDRNSLAIRKFLNTKHPDLNHSAKKIPPMQLLAEAAQALNAQEFRLPAELQTIQERFPGREIPPAESTPSSSAPATQQQQNSVPAPHEYDSNGLIPLPAKKCHFCRLSCRASPLIKCNYCPLYFHPDCLDPPLAAVPKDQTWMCPAHVEHFLDANFLRSLSATERWSLWQRHARQPLNEHVVKLNFLRKGGAKFPPFRRRIWHPASIEKTKVPAAVKAHYRKRVDPLGNLETAVQLEHLAAAAAGPNVNGGGDSSSTHLFKDQQEFLTSLRQLQMQILLEICPKSVRNNKRAASEEKSVQQNATAAPAKRSRRNSDGNHFKTENHKILPAQRKREAQKLKPLAILKPISWDDSELICITKRTTKVGSAPMCDIVLAGDCAAISGHHFTLIFDRLDQRFELLNYSPFGVEIDGVRYSMGHPSDSQDRPQGSSVDGKIRSFLGQGKPPPVDATKLAPSWPCAQCAQSNAKSGTLVGFDGPAQLRNGSVICVGCVKLLFVIPSP